MDLCEIQKRNSSRLETLSIELLAMRNLTEPCSKHWILPQNVGSAHNVRQPPVQVMPNVRLHNHYLTELEDVSSRSAGES